MVPMNARRPLLVISTVAALLAGAGLASTALAGARAPAAPALIGKLSVKDKANASHWSVQAGLAKGKKAYGDATATFTSVPTALSKAAWIRDADKSRTSTADPLATFTLSRAADVYVGLDSRAVKPSWLDATWNAVTATEKVSGGVMYHLWRKQFASGAVALGPQGSAKTAKVRQYTIAAVPTAVATNDFSVAVSPASQTVQPGKTATFTVGTAVVSGQPDAVALTANLGTATVTPASVAPRAGATLTVTTKATDSGTVTVTVTGKDSFATHTASVSLTIGSGGGTSYEAESPTNTLSGKAKARACAFCSGGGEVGGILGHGSSDALQFNGVMAPADGTYDVTWWYISGDPNGDTKCGGEPNPPKQGCRPGDLVVNGVSQGIFQFPDTANWHTLGSLTVKLKLKAGANTIRISSKTADVADIDRIVVAA
jgi:hypothetical protein